MSTISKPVLKVSFALASLLVTMALAQTLPVPPKPGPEQEKLAYFAGTWKSDGDIKPGPFGAGGKYTYMQTCEWFDGHFALVCHFDSRIQQGSIKGLSIMGWDQADKTYTYYETNTLGENVFFRGTVEGNIWTWNHESNANGKTLRSRYTLQQVAPDSATYKFEMGADGEPMKLIMDGKQTRTK